MTKNTREELRVAGHRTTDFNIEGILFTRQYEEGICLLRLRLL